MMAFSGVRSSWDMFARNCDLCWLASASCPIRLVELLEQAGVLDRDDRLIGERLQQCDLSLAESVRLEMVDREHSDNLIAVQQRRVSTGAEAELVRNCPAVGKIVAHGLLVRDVDGPSFEDGAARERA